MITEIALKNFKCYKKLDTIQLAQVNLLAGSNGRGKSSFIQSLLLLAQSLDSEKRLKHLVMNGRFVELGTFADVQNSGKEGNPTIHYKTDDKDESDILITFSSYENKAQWGEIVSFTLSGKELIEEMGSATGENEGQKSHGLIVTSTAVAGLSQLYNVYYISADRRGPVDFVKKNDNRDDNQIGVHGEFLINSLAKKGKDFTDKVAGELSKILSGATIQVENTDTDYLRFYLDSVNDSKGFRPTNVGFGYSYILPIVMTLMLAEKGAKIFIENPEAHLHPGAQSRLADFLMRKSKERDLQLFIETHSDHIINGLRIAIVDGVLEKSDARILFFSREELGDTNVYQIKIDSKGNLSDYPDGFMDEWGIQMSKLV